ncbi:hypothetical protein D030_4387A, partial [Vibrio parahaemolyticus AQ3810]|jgi:hypothetical protein
MLPQ